MADAIVDVPALALTRSLGVPTVWPLSVPALSITRSPLTPSVSLSANVAVPLLTIHRSLFAPSVTGFNPATAVVTFDIQRGRQRFDITKDIVTPTS